MKCQECGHDNPANAQFCGVCGINLITGQASVETEPMVNFGAAITRGFGNYFTFSGRATRAEFWWWVLFTTLAQLIPFMGWIISLAVLIPSLSVTSRRLHDIGKSGWWQLGVILGIVAVCGYFVFVVVLRFLIGWGQGAEGSADIFWWMILLVGLLAGFGIAVWWIRWLVRQGETGPNQYGPDPRYSTS